MHTIQKEGSRQRVGAIGGGSNYHCLLVEAIGVSDCFIVSMCCHYICKSCVVEVANYAFPATGCVRHARACYQYKWQFLSDEDASAKLSLILIASLMHGLCAYRLHFGPFA